MPLIRVRDDDSKIVKHRKLVKLGVTTALIVSAGLYQWNPGLATYIGLVPVAVLSVLNFVGKE